MDESLKKPQRNALICIELKETDKLAMLFSRTGSKINNENISGTVNPERSSWYPLANADYNRLLNN